jgi:DNA polymerase-3 subunit delta'
VHPNVLWVEPDKAGGVIKIDQIRNISEFVNQTSLQDGMRIAVIHPANAMNLYAANALLKTLEEPPAGAIMILICDQKSQLPATILSRCHRVAFPRPQKELALTWLKDGLSNPSSDLELALALAEGAPLKAKQLITGKEFAARQDLFKILHQLTMNQNDPIECAATIQEWNITQLLDFIFSWSMDLLKLKLGYEATYIVNKDFISILSELNLRISIHSIKLYLSHLQFIREQWLKGVHLNKTLMLEDLLVKWMGCFYVFS